MLRLRAEIYLNKKNGLNNPGFNGMQPSFNLGKDLIICKIRTLDDSKTISLGHKYNVLMELPYGEAFTDIIKLGFEFGLNIGSKIIGKGKVIKIIDPKSYELEDN